MFHLCVLARPFRNRIERDRQLSDHDSSSGGGLRRFGKCVNWSKRTDSMTCFNILILHTVCLEGRARIDCEESREIGRVVQPILFVIKSIGDVRWHQYADTGFRVRCVHKNRLLRLSSRQRLFGFERCCPLSDWSGVTESRMPRLTRPVRHGSCRAAPSRLADP